MAAIVVDPFPLGTNVKILKEGRQHGQYGVVTDTNWNGMIKIEVTTGSHKGTTKSYRASHLERDDRVDAKSSDSKVDSPGTGMGDVSAGGLRPPGRVRHPFGLRWECRFHRHCASDGLARGEQPFHYAPSTP